MLIHENAYTKFIKKFHCTICLVLKKEKKEIANLAHRQKFTVS